jgi:hypothetical protein
MLLLEVACGTGRLHTFIKDNWPRMRSVATDLSPFYLQVSRKAPAGRPRPERLIRESPIRELIRESRIRESLIRDSLEPAET